MKRKMLAIVLGAVLTTSLLAGCGKETSTTTDTEDDQKKVEQSKEPKATEAASKIEGEITVLTNRTDLIDTKFAEYKKNFEQKYPGTTVKFEAITDYEKDVAIRMQTTEYGDVLSIPNSVPNTEFPDFFEPLGTVDEYKDQYKEDFLYNKYYDGKIYGLPSTINAQGMVYNKKVFQEAGITELPKTPEEFLNDLKLIKEKTKAIPYYTNFGASWPLTQWQDQCWGSVSGDADYHNNIMPREKDPFSPGKSNYIVHKLLYDIVKEGLCEKDPVTTDWEKSKVMINNGEIGVMDLGSWAIVQMQSAGEHAEDIAYMPFPYNIDGKQYSTAGADYSYAINKNSENKETARAWIDYMINESGFALSEGGISLVKEDTLPDALKDFTQVTLIVDKPAKKENDGLFDKLSNESEIGLYSDVEKKRIVEAALGTTDETFDDIMNDWNERWTEAQDENITD